MADTELSLTYLEDRGVAATLAFAAGAVATGLKKDEALDLALLVSRDDCAAAAVFTQNQVVAAPVIVDRQTLATNNTAIRAVIANAGNANACTGEPGLANAQAMQQQTATAIGCQPEQVLVLSTGVIGVQLPMDKVEAGIKGIVSKLSRRGDAAAAQAIMTTDTYPKQIAVQVKLAKGTVTIGGMAKGSGMIHPNMATMLGLLTTDAEVEPEALSILLKTAVDQSFNRISIDGDTSTNDTVLLLANGASRISVDTMENLAIFGRALTQVCQQLAHMIVRDGEGATKFVEIQVTGAKTNQEALQIAQTIATSPLVKTAFAGSDANWGRILAAAGRAGIIFDQNKIDLWVGSQNATELQLVAAGTPTPYQETEAAAIFAQPQFIIQLNLNQGNGHDIMWTSDLTHDYVTINADYRT